MNQFLAKLSDIKIVIAIIVIIVFLLLWLLIQKLRSGKYNRTLSELEERFSKVKSVPISLKMNKAVAISRVDTDTASRVSEAKESFDKVQADITSISANLADAEDAIASGRLAKANTLLASAQTDLAVTENKVTELESLLDQILARETEQRQEVTSLKNRFRAIKAQANENQSKLSYCWAMIEGKISDTEKMFSTFEEWMFSNDYDRANAQLDLIRDALDELQSELDELPSLLEDARGIIPKMAEKLHADYVSNRNRGVYLKHLEVEKNVQIMTESLREDLKKIKAGNIQGMRAHLNDYKKRLTQMSDAVAKESEAYDTIQSYAKETEELAAETNRLADYVQKSYTKSSVKFGLEGMDSDLNKQQEELKRLNDMQPRVYENVHNFQIPASTVMVSLKELNEQFSTCSRSLKDMRDRIEMASGDEDRAKKQLVKLQIIMNQMQRKIRRYKLPSISETYESDMRKANDYVHKLDDLMKEDTLNMQLLNATLQEALDFIYKLYNNVNNVVGTVVMVENTIVFGNRYRSTYADIDSELTRSELCFRNGEYTQALTVAIATIEKIHPGNYESMIKENAKGAE
ncbi:MAG: septation ring formation regulator EzrA [Solobacterium sp.]|nr:septation ring formation regulator EzrA [Solobacterium sp.]